MDLGNTTRLKSSQVSLVIYFAYFYSSSFTALAMASVIMGLGVGLARAGKLGVI